MIANHLSNINSLIITKIRMSSSRKYLSLKELRERESMMIEELRLIREEIERRETSGDLSTPGWKVAMPTFRFPERATPKEILEDEQNTKFNKESHKALMLIAKAKIEAGITETILEEHKKKKKIIPKVQQESEGAAEVSDA
jgi:hypothetical protein